MRHIGASDGPESEAVEVPFSGERQEVHLRKPKVLGQAECGFHEIHSESASSDFARHRNRAEQRTVEVDLQGGRPNDSLIEPCDQRRGEVLQETLCGELALFDKAEHLVCIFRMRSRDFRFHLTTRSSFRALIRGNIAAVAMLPRAAPGAPTPRRTRSCRRDRQAQNTAVWRAAGPDSNDRTC
jgi:hypothetical protein